VKGWEVSRVRVPLKEEYLEIALARLNKGENLFSVVPELPKNVFRKSSLNVCFFERRRELVWEGEVFQSSEGYKQVGRLLVPPHRVFSRNNLELLTDEKRKGYSNYGGAKKALDTFPTADIFYIGEDCNGYLPLVKNEVLVLNEDQLKV
jgi:hypothetical protein